VRPGPHYVIALRRAQVPSGGTPPHKYFLLPSHRTLHLRPDGVHHASLRSVSCTWQN
jgi:hypothetical protein